MATIRMHRTVDAPRAVVWDVISDQELYGEVASNHSSIEVVEGEGEGMIRHCVDPNGYEWTESCTHWEEGHSFAVSVDVENSEYHRRFFTWMNGEWGIVEREDGIRITVTITWEPRYGPLGVIISKYFEYKGSEIIETIFDRWEDEIRQRSVEEPTPTGRLQH